MSNGVTSPKNGESNYILIWSDFLPIFDGINNDETGCIFGNDSINNVV